MTTTDASAETQQSDPIRHTTISILDALIQRARQFDLPESPAALEWYERKLRANEYNVLVVGEIKRGKSSFVNALIGQSLLPTDVDVATSAVFRIARAERAGYRLRFQDGTAKEIEREDLPRYGSQVEADRGQALRPESLVRWIEVDVPGESLRFLTEGMSLIDTPGLGSLYAAHARITQDLVPEADAIIFVLGSERPITSDELEFLETLVRVTPNIFFVQTQTDKFRRADWRAVLQRNQELLQGRFGERLPGARVWPFSSTHLLRAATEGDDEFRTLSGYPDMERALRAFLFNASGWSRCAEALVVSRRFHDQGGATLRSRLSTLGEESKQHRQELRQRAQQRKVEFETSWGPRGRAREELLVGIGRRIGLAKRTFADALLPKSRLFVDIENRINALATVAEVNELGPKLAEDVVAAVVSVWQRVSQGAWNDCNDLLAPLLRDAQVVTLPADVPAPQLTGGFDPIKDGFLAVATRARGEVLTVTYLTGMGLAAMGVLFPPMAAAGAIVGAAVGIAGFYRGWEPAKEAHLKSARGVLIQRVHDVRMQLHHHFFAADLDTGRAGLVDEYFANLEQVMTERIRDAVEQKTAEAQKELTWLMQQEQRDEQGRREESLRIQQQLGSWEEVLPHIDALRRTMGHARYAAEVQDTMLAGTLATETERLRTLASDLGLSVEEAQAVEREVANAVVGSMR